jgi:hypothetical protein
MKNQDTSIQGKTVSAEKFHPPARCDTYMDNKFTGPCFVYDPASWRNRNKRSSRSTDESK